MYQISGRTKSCWAAGMKWLPAAQQWWLLAGGFASAPLKETRAPAL